MWSPEKSGTRTVSPIGASFAAASTSVMLVPLPPKSHSTITPADGSPGFERSAVSAAVASDTSGDRLRPGLLRSAPRSASTTDGRQCAGTVTATSDTGAPFAALRASPSSASASSISGRCWEPSWATIGTGSPTRSTNPVSVSPRSSVTAAGRTTGRCPSPVPARLVAPMARPSALPGAALRIRHVTPLRQVGKERLGRP